MKKQELINDLEYLLKKLPKVHKNLYALITKEKFLEVGKAITEEVSHKDFKKKNFIFTLLKLFHEIKDPHTTIYTNDKKMPIYFEWVDGGYYPFVINKNLGNFLGKKLIKIDGLDIDRFNVQIEKYLVFDNEEIRKIEIGRSLRDFSLIKLISKSNEGEIEYTFENNKSIKIKPSRKNESTPQTSIYGIKGNEFLNMRSNYFVESRSNQFYFKYSRCKEDNNYPFEKLFIDIKQVLNNHPMKIIVDLRNNQGGNSSLFNPIIKILKAYIKENKPEVYCLINRRVFSSGVLNTYEMKYKLGAKLVGQPTGQGVNHYGEVKYIRLPNTKIEVQYSSKYFKLINDDSVTIKPDVMLEPKIKDYMNGNDIVLNYCLE